jgi:hypothetical protein
MPEQYDSFNEKTKLIETSLKYTNGDMEKAKAMASGQYLDVVVVKVKFYLPKAGKSGLFLAFFNIFDEYISYIDAAFVNIQASMRAPGCLMTGRSFSAM